RLIDADTGADLVHVTPYGDGFTGGVRVAVGDVTGDGVPDLITAPGPGGGPVVRVFDGTTGAAVAGPLGSLVVFDPAFRGGAFVAAGDVDADGVTDIVTGAGPGGGAAVGTYRGSDGARTGSFFAADPAGRDGVRVGVTDGNGGSVIEAAVPTQTGQQF